MVDFFHCHVSFGGGGVKCNPSQMIDVSVFSRIIAAILSSMILVFMTCIFRVWILKNVYIKRLYTYIYIYRLYTYIHIIFNKHDHIEPNNGRVHWEEVNFPLRQWHPFWCFFWGKTSGESRVWRTRGMESSFNRDIGGSGQGRQGFPCISTT